MPQTIPFHLPFGLPFRSLQQLLLPILLVLFCSIFQNATAQCNTNNNEMGVCVDDTFIVTAPNPSINSTYHYNPAPLNGQGQPIGKFYNNQNTYPFIGNSASGVVSVTTIDTVLLCTTIVNTTIHVSGHQLNAFAPTLVSAPWAGDTTQVNQYIYERFADINYSQTSNYSVSGGTLVSVTGSGIVGNFPFTKYHDTLRVRWTAPGSKSIGVHLNIYDDTNFLAPAITCTPSENFPIPEPDVQIIGDSILCQPGTFSYYSFNVNGASYSWQALGGSILNGQGSHAVDVQWTSAPDRLICTRTLNSVVTQDTMHIQLHVFNPLVADTAQLCPSDSVLLDAGNATSWNWSTGATTQSIYAASPGIYWVDVVSDSCGFSGRDSILVQAISVIQPQLGNDTVLCPGAFLTLDAGPGFSNYLWSNGGNSQASTYASGVSASVITTDINGCTAMDTMEINLVPTSVPHLGPDSSFCDGDSVVLQSGLDPQHYTLLWNNATTSDSLVCHQTGTYWLSSTDSFNCTVRDSVELTLASIPNPVVNNQSACPGTAISLLGQAGFTSYLWSTGSTSQNSVGGPGSYWLEVTNQQGCLRRDTMNVNALTTIPVNLPPDTILCADTTMQLTAPAGASSYQWSTGATSQGVTLPLPGTYRLTVTAFNTCRSYDTTVVALANDCVFPGDANYDGIADNQDVLAIGVGFGATGPIRPSSNNQWYGQACNDWTDTLLTGSNYKQIDCSGNGIINANDTLAITLNYGFTHNKTDHVSASGTAVNVVADFDSVMVGDTAVFRIEIGDSITPADSIYGVSFTVNYDTSEVDSQGIILVNYDQCWLGTPGQNLLTFMYDHAPSPYADLAMVRTTGTDTSGFGEICRIGFVTIDNISGKREILARPLQVWLTDIHLITHEMIALEATSTGDSTIVWEQELRNRPGIEDDGIQLFPNPASNLVTVDAAHQEIMQIEAFSMEGNQLLEMEGQGRARLQLKLDEIPAGVTFLRIRTVEGIYVRKLVVVR